MTDEVTESGTERVQEGRNQGKEPKRKQAKVIQFEEEVAGEAAAVLIYNPSRRLTQNLMQRNTRTELTPT